MFLALSSDNISVIVVATIVALFITIAIIYLTLNILSNDKYKKVIHPSLVNEEIIVYEKNKEIKKRVKRKSLLLSLKDTKLNDKIESWYTQGGKPDGDILTFIKMILTFFMLSVAMLLAIYLAFGNLIVGAIVFVIFLGLPILDFFGNIMERRTKFVNEFPYFLQTLSFVLDNGGNILTSFPEVVEKQRDGVLKDVMREVIVVQKTNGGNYGKAFSIIAERIHSEETKEFVLVVENALSKGVPVAKVLASQGETMSRFTANRKLKQVKNMSNTIMVPILLIIGAIALLFL